MPELRPFKAVRYAGVGDLADLVCPPYDLIGAREQARLHARHRYNAVRIELPFALPGESDTERYARAGAEFRSWLDSGVLAYEGSERLYAYRQEYSHGNGTAAVTGVVGALSVAGYRRPDGTLPHENTMPGPLRDRLALLHAYPFNISPIEVVYRGGGATRAVLRDVCARTPDERVTDDGGVVHSLWGITDPAVIDAAAGPVRRGPVIIADGHHRFETALAFHEENAGRPGGHDAVMCFCIDADSEAAVVRPWHRALRAALDGAEIQRRLEVAFGAATGAGAPGAHAISMVLPGRRLEIAVDPAAVEAATPGRAEPWRRLGAVALHEVVIPRVFGNGVDSMRFSTEPDEIVELVDRGGYAAGAILDAPEVHDVVEIALAGERVPPKSTYFWPKPITGLVFRSLE